MTGYPPSDLILRSDFLENVEIYKNKIVEITINKKKFFKNVNETAFIPKGATHRIENPFNKSVQIVEVQTGSILKESDIVRYKDVYGRVN